MDNVLKRINFFERLNTLKHTTLEGEATMDSIKEGIKINGETFTESYKIIESLKRSNDPALRTWADAKASLIEKKHMYSYRIGLMLERIQDSKQVGEVNLHDKLQYLREMDESSVVEHVKRKGLENYRNVPELNFIHESVNGSDSIEKPFTLSNFEVYTSISPVQQKNGNTFFMLEGAVIAATPDQFEIAEEVPSQEFAETAQQVEEIPYDPDTNNFVENTPMGTIAVNPENGAIALNDETVSPKVLQEKAKQHITVNALVEHIATGLRRQVDSMIALSKSCGMLNVLDSTKTVKNLITNESVSVLVHPNSGKAFILEKSSRGNSLSHVNSLTEAITAVKELTNINISESFKKDLKKERKVFEAQEFYNAEASENLKQLEKKLNEIDEEIALTADEEAKGKLEELKKQCNEAAEIIRKSLK